MMKDIDRALADISDMRSQLAAGTMFRGFGPAVMALSGGLAALAAICQVLPTRLRPVIETPGSFGQVKALTLWWPL